MCYVGVGGGVWGKYVLFWKSYSGQKPAKTVYFHPDVLLCTLLSYIHITNWTGLTVLVDYSIKNTIYAWTGTIKNVYELLVDIDIFTSILNLINYNGQIREHQD